MGIKVTVVFFTSENLEDIDEPLKLIIDSTNRLEVCIHEGHLVIMMFSFYPQLASINGQQFQTNGTMPATLSVKNCVQLASCGPNELLPMNPELPADLFTACLTTPIKIALKW